MTKNAYSCQKEQMIQNKTINNYQTIIWDWNGTLLNDIQLCVGIVNKMLIRHNDLQLDTSSYRAVFGFPITAYYERIGIDFEKESFEQLTETFISSYLAAVQKCALHENVVEVLTTFQAQKREQFILTAAHKESVMPLLDHYHIRQFIKQVEGLDNHRAESKEQRGIHLIEDNQIDRNTAVLIGDTIHDFEVATAIGVDCILIAHGHQSKARLQSKTNNTITVLDSLAELIA